jgi:hypothetical protein
LSDNVILETKFFWNFSLMLASGKDVNLSFSSFNTWNIIVDNWWPVFYKVYSWSIVYSSWLITDSKYDIPVQSGSELSLENLWWLAKINLSFDSNTWVIYPYNYLIIKKNIWWIYITKEIIQKE